MTSVMPLSRWMGAVIPFCCRGPKDDRENVRHMHNVKFVSKSGTAVKSESAVINGR